MIVGLEVGEPLSTCTATVREQLVRWHNVGVAFKDAVVILKGCY